MPLLSRFYQLKKSRQYNVVSKSLLTVKVELLDGTPVECTLPAESTAHDCLVNVCQRFGIKQCEFFGLQYVSKLHTGQRRWLDLERPLRQQLQRLAVANYLHFGVVFYVTDVNVLHDEMTRSQYYLQLKSDVQEGKLHASYEQAVMLASYSLQVELADFDANRHTLDHISRLSLFPKHMVEDEERKCTLYEAARQTHATLRGLSQQLAEVYFIMEVQQLEGYGQHHFLCRDERGDDALVGASLTGIVVRKVGSHCSKFYRWQEIANLHNHKRNFGVELSSGCTVQFSMADKSLAKYVWQISVQQHKFFKMQRTSLNQTGIISQLPLPDIQAMATNSRSPVTLAAPSLKPSTPATELLAGQPTDRPFQSGYKRGRAGGDHVLSVTSDVTPRLPLLVKDQQRRSLSDDTISCVMSGGDEAGSFTTQQPGQLVFSTADVITHQPPTNNELSAVRHRSQPDVFNVHALQATRHTDRSVYGNFTDLSCLSATDTFRRSSTDPSASSLTYSTPELATCAQSAVHNSDWEPNNNNNNSMEERASLHPLIGQHETKYLQRQHSPPPYSKTASSSTPNLLSLQCTGPDLIVSSTHCVTSNNSALCSGLSLSSTHPDFGQQNLLASNSQHSQNCVSSEELERVYSVVSPPTDCSDGSLRSSLSPRPGGNQPIYVNLSAAGSMQPDLQSERRVVWPKPPGSWSAEPAGSVAPSWAHRSNDKHTARPVAHAPGSATLRRLKETLLVASRLHPPNSTRGSASSSGSSSGSHTRPASTRLSTVSRHEQCNALQERLNSVMFRQEFESVMKRRDSAEFTTAQRPENVPRNRFSDVLPYEDNRVRVTPSRLNPCGYINASHVSVSVGERQCFYMAAQSPQADTLLDFWRAVWENHVYLVVMFSAVGEEVYWPQGDGLICRCSSEEDCGDHFEVRRRASSRGPAHLTSQLNISRRRGRAPLGSSSRTLWHVQYEGWSDGVMGAGGRAAFIQLLQEMSVLAAPASGSEETSGPVLVHCGAGVGATGVTIMCHVLLHCIDHNVPLQPHRLLLHLRQQRMLMVRTLDQYRLVYQVLIDYLGGSRLI